MDHTIQKHLDFFLRPDEHVLWHSKPRAFGVTDQRVMTIKRDGCANAIERENVDDCKLMPLDFKGMSLVVGSCLFPEGGKQLRWRALHPKLGRYAKSDDGLTVAEGLVFYNIPDADAALKLLRKAA